MKPLQFCLPIFLGSYRNPKQRAFLNSCEGFLMAALTGHCHPGPVWIIAKMVLHRISKILFVYGSYEFLTMLEGKIREAPFFFKVQSGKITVLNLNFQMSFSIASLENWHLPLCVCKSNLKCPIFSYFLIK